MSPHDGFSESTRLERIRFAREANAIALDKTGNRPKGVPVLTGYSGRASILAWLQWDDPNGAYTDAHAKSEGMQPYNLEQAWEALRIRVREYLHSKGAE